MARCYLYEPLINMLNYSQTLSLQETRKKKKKKRTHTSDAVVRFFFLKNRTKFARY